MCASDPNYDETQIRWREKKMLILSFTHYRYRRHSSSAVYHLLAIPYAARFFSVNFSRIFTQKNI